MNIALVHDYLKDIGGGEMVLMELKGMFPDAPVFTAYKFPQYWGRYQQALKTWQIHESWGKYLPFLPKFMSYYTILSPLFFSSMDLSGYDVVIISATGAYFPNGIKIGPNTKVITYCHTPPRFLYGFPTATTERNKWYWRPISLIANHILRMVDFTWAKKPTVFIANSKNVANRIRKFYRRESKIIYPPIEIPIYSNPVTKKDYYLIISRIVGSKNIELAVAAANKHGFILKVAGVPIGKSGQQIVGQIQGPTVEYLGEVSETTKQQLLAEAKGFLALEEQADFGMSTVEPMAFGTPVVAFKNGGYLETVDEGKTGIFFDEMTTDSLWRAIQKLEKTKWNLKVLRANAGKFSKEKFKKQMLELVDNYA